MIISVSRRTDIPALYSEWFMNRLKEGYLLIPYPRNANRIGRVQLSPNNVDCIAFWTKNPAPMLKKLSLLNAMGYAAYYIQFTLTPYDKSVESGLPPKAELLETFMEMSRRIGKKRSIWRYDPVFIDGNHSINWHIAKFSEMCKKLQGYTEHCAISFIDVYRNIASSFRAMTQTEIKAIAEAFSHIAGQCGISLYTCSEEIDLLEYGIGHNACVDKDLIEQIIGYEIKAKRDVNQRSACKCIESVDIGAYDTCSHGCAYCYATSSKKTVLRNVAEHNPNAPMITGFPRGDEIISERTTESQKIEQISLF